MINDLKKILQSSLLGLKGLSHAYHSDRSFRLEILYGIPAYLVVGWVLWPFAAWELALYVFTYVLILVVELVNTAFETMLDRIHPETHELIGKSKDIASAAVLLTFFFAIFVVIMLAWTRCPMLMHYDVGAVAV